MHSQHLAPCFFILSSTFASRGDSSFWLSMKFPSFVYRVPVCPPEQSLPSSQRKYLLRVFFQRSIFHLTAPISSEEVNLMTLICKSSSFFFFSFFCLAHLTCLVIFEGLCFSISWTRRISPGQSQNLIMSMKPLFYEH